MSWLRALLSERYYVANYSMLPTLGPGDRVLVSRLAYRLRRPARGEIVLFEHPLRRGTHALKRLVGLPGEHVELQGTTLLVDGREVPEPYVQPAWQDDVHWGWALGGAEHLVLGDNRALSRDGRHFGPLDRRLLRGPVWGRY